MNRPKITHLEVRWVERQVEGYDEDYDIVVYLYPNPCGDDDLTRNRHQAWSWDSWECYSPDFAKVCKGVWHVGDQGWVE